VHRNHANAGYRSRLRGNNNVLGKRTDHRNGQAVLEQTANVMHIPSNLFANLVGRRATRQVW